MGALWRMKSGEMRGGMLLRVKSGEVNGGGHYGIFASQAIDL